MQRKPLRSVINRKHPLAAGLVAAWHFDSLRGVLTEQVGNLQVADQGGTFARLRTGLGAAGAWKTSGAADHVNYGDKLPRTGRAPYTLFAVVRPGPGGVNQYLIGRSGNIGGFNSYEYLFSWQSTGAFGNFRSDTFVGANDATANNFPAGRVYRVAMTYDGTNMRTYVNGRLEGANTHAVNVNGASNKLYFGAQFNVTTPAYQEPWKGEIYDVKVWHRCLSPAAVAKLSADPWGMYRAIPLERGRGLNLNGALPDSTQPVVTNVTPAAGTPLARADSLAFRVTDPGGNLSRTTVLASYPDIAAMEVVFFNGAFGPQYTGTRSVIGNGFQFSDVIRRGGWPAAPTIILDAGDTAGNENV